jgi:hypothetical protein
VFDGAEVELEALHPYFATVKEAEVSAEKQRANWIVIRLHQPGESGK